MARPVIGITTYGPDDAQELEDADLPSFTLPTVYVDAVERAGGLAVLLPPMSLADGRADAILDRLDALILSGGGDIDPRLYDGGEHPTVYMVSAERDRFELDLTARALTRELPLLGICRGMQVLNIALGGDLELHLPDAFGTSVDHRLPPREPTVHEVRIESGCLLDSIYGERVFPVCSWHHQGVRTLGRGLVAVASAPDSVIEGVVSDAHDFALGVQWHPEMQVADDERQRRLFEAVVARAQDGER